MTSGSIHSGSWRWAYAFALVPLTLHVAARGVAAIVATLPIERILDSVPLSALTVEQRQVLVAMPVITNDPAVFRRAVGLLARSLETIESPISAIGLILLDLPDSKASEPTESEAQFLSSIGSELQSLAEQSKPKRSVEIGILFRHRRWSRTQQQYIGWNRKVGKLIALFELVASGTSEYVADGDITDRIRGAKYAIIIDEDSRLLQNSAAELVCAMAASENQPRCFDGSGRAARGYGILHPQLTHRSVVGETRQSFFDVVGEVRHCGKGIYNIAYCYSRFRKHFPDEWSVSHDMIEGVLVRTGFVSSAGLEEGMPGSVSLMLVRSHRWHRGDWQNLVFFIRAWLSGMKWTACNWLMMGRDIRLALVTPCLAVVLVSIGVTGDTTSAMLIALMSWSHGPPVMLRLLRSAGIRARVVVVALTRLLLFGLIRIIGAVSMAIHSASMEIDAMCRGLYRSITKRNLLEWKSAMHLETLGSAGEQNLATVYAWATSAISLIVLLVYQASPWPRAWLLESMLGLWAIGPPLWFLAMSKPKTSGTDAS